MSPEPSRDLEEQLAEIRGRIYWLEETLRQHGIAPRVEAVRPAASRVVESGPALAEPAIAEPVVYPVPQPVPQFAPQAVFNYYPTQSNEDHRSLESKVGSQWFNRIGILAMLIGMALFLKLAIDNHWIGPLGRVLIGLGAGAGLMAWSERFRSRGYPGFSYSLKAVGSGILYLSLWAAFSLFHLLPSGVAFAAMILVTAFNAFMAWRQDAELLALYAIVGGLSTPLLVSTGENHEVALFLYLLLLNLATLVLVALKPWSRMLFGGFLGTVLLFTGWWLSYYSNAQAGTTAVFLTSFFLIFALAPRLVRIDMAYGQLHSTWDGLALVVLPIANASLGFLGFYAMLEGSSGGAWAEPWVAVGFAAFFLGLLRLPARGRLQAAPPILAGLHLAAAVVFLTIAIPLKAQGRWLTIGWLVEGAALLWVARRVGPPLLRWLAVLCLVLGVAALLVVHPETSTTPLFNARFGTYCAGIAVFAFAAWLAYTAAQGEDEHESTMPWRGLAAASVLVVNALILLAIGWEIHSYWWFRNWQGDWQRMSAFQMYAHFTYSAFFMLFGALLLAVGFWRRSAFLRWQAMVLVAATIGKVFLVDTSQLSQGFRVLSFLALGALLLGVSFIYQRDLLHLRNPADETSPEQDHV